MENKIYRKGDKIIIEIPFFDETKIKIINNINRII